MAAGRPPARPFARAGAPPGGRAGDHPSGTRERASGGGIVPFVNRPAEAVEKGCPRMRNIITWSVRGKNPWIVIAVWVVIAGALSMGPKLQSVTSNDASKSLAATVESKRADALQQAAFPDAKGTPMIVVYSADAPLTSADKAAIEAGKDWLRAVRSPSTAPASSTRRTARARSSSPAWTATRATSRSATPCRQSATTSARPRRGWTSASPAPGPHHRRLQDLPQRRHQAARRHRDPGAGAAPAHLPLAGAAVRATRRRRVRVLRGRRHPRPDRERARTSRSRGRRPR